jgi:hypothetical protein
VKNTLAEDENGNSSYEDVAQQNIQRKRLARAIHDLVGTVDVADVARVLKLIESQAKCAT